MRAALIGETRRELPSEAQSVHVERGSSGTGQGAYLWTKIEPYRASSLSSDKKKESEFQTICCAGVIVILQTPRPKLCYNDCRSPRGALKGYEPKYTAGGCRKNDDTTTGSHDDCVTATRTRRTRGDLLYSLRGSLLMVLTEYSRMLRGLQ